MYVTTKYIIELPKNKPANVQREDVRNRLQFWNQFQKIDKDPNLDLHDKFACLHQALEMDSIAEELIKSFPPTGESYRKTLKQLQNHFGKEQIFIQETANAYFAETKYDREVLKKII